jgi:hypothetical protein
MIAIPAMWEEREPAVRILKLWAIGLQPEWPRIVILDLAPASFQEFETDVLAFARKYNLFPDQPLRWVSGGVKPAIGEGLPPAPDATSQWRVVLIHRKASMAVYAACPHA